MFSPENSSDRIETQTDQEFDTRSHQRDHVRDITTLDAAYSE